MSADPSVTVIGWCALEPEVMICANDASLAAQSGPCQGTFYHPRLRVIHCHLVLRDPRGLRWEGPRVQAACPAELRGETETAREHLRQGACDCGIVVWRTIEQAYRSANRRPLVLAEVAGWGVVVEQEHGWRCEGATTRYFEVVLPSQEAFLGAQDLLLYGLGAAFGRPAVGRYVAEAAA